MAGRVDQNDQILSKFLSLNVHLHTCKLIGPEIGAIN